MIRQQCEVCGQPNPDGDLFCSNCNTYLAWDPTMTVPVVRVTDRRPEQPGATEAAGGTAVLPPASAPPVLTPWPQPPAAPQAAAVTPEPAGKVAAAKVRIELTPAAVDLTPGAAPADVTATLRNRSAIVEAYVVEAPSAPEWLHFRGAEIRLLPDESGTVLLSAAVREGRLPAVQTTSVTVRARSQVSADVTAETDLGVAILPVGRPVMIAVQPSVIRVKDDVVGEFQVVVDNAANNHPVRVELSARDLENVTATTFSPPSLDVPAGRVETVGARIRAPLPEPGEEISRQVTVTSSDGTRTTQSAVTFVQRTSARVVDPPVVLRPQPSVLQVLDSSQGQLRLEIDNSAGRERAHVVLSGHDAEGRVYFRFSPSVLDVEPGAIGVAGVSLEGPLPEPGGQADRPFTVVARYADRVVEASGTFRQRRSPAPISAVKIRIEPPQVRVQDSSRAKVRVVVDNRAGSQPARMWLIGRDYEGAARISFSAPYVDVYPGQEAYAVADIRAPRPPSGTERSRPFTVLASDGTHEVGADGSFTQTSSDRRLLWRLFFTLLGVAAMVAGTFLPWTRDSGLTGVQWTVRAVAALFGKQGPHLASLAERFARAGVVVIAFAILAAWGLLGRTGRLTRLAALLCLLLVVAFLVFLQVKAHDGAPDAGTILIMAGCVSAYAGGHLVKR